MSSTAATMIFLKSLNGFGSLVAFLVASTVDSVTLASIRSSIWCFIVLLQHNFHPSRKRKTRGKPKKTTTTTITTKTHSRRYILSLSIATLNIYEFLFGIILSDFRKSFGNVLFILQQYLIF